MAYIPYDTLVSALRRNLDAEGFKLSIYPGADRLCRCCSGAHKTRGPFVRGWNPGGVGVHITGGGLGLRSLYTYVRDILVSDPSLPLKSQFATRPKTGEVMLISAGRCNHLGGIGSGAAHKIRTGGFDMHDDWDDAGRGTGTDGNALAWGIENIAAVSMDAKQRRASVIICATIAHLSGDDWNGGEDCGHGEVSNQRGRPDPNLNMGAFRRDVALLTTNYRKGLNQKPQTTPAPKPANPKEYDQMATKQEIQDAVRGVVREEVTKFLGDVIDAPIGTPAEDLKRNSKWMAASYWRHTYRNVQLALAEAKKARELAEKIARKVGV